jgi:hypothetical protein
MIAFKKFLSAYDPEYQETGALEHDFFNLQNALLVQFAAKWQ